MWNNEVIWSEGDLMSHLEDYQQWLDTEAGGPEDRLFHIGSMILRLEAEQKLLLAKSADPCYTKNS